MSLLQLPDEPPWMPGQPAAVGPFAFDCETDVPPAVVRLAAAYDGYQLWFIRPEHLDDWFAASVGPAIAHTARFDRRLTHQPDYDWVDVSDGRSLARMAEDYLGIVLPKPPRIRLHFNPDDPEHRQYLADDVAVVWSLHAVAV